MKKLTVIVGMTLLSYWLWCVFSIPDIGGKDRAFELMVVDLLHIPVGAALLLFSTRGYGNSAFAFSILAAPLVHLVAAMIGLPHLLYQVAPAVLSIFVGVRELWQPAMRTR